MASLKRLVTYPHALSGIASWTFAAVCPQSTMCSLPTDTCARGGSEPQHRSVQELRLRAMRLGSVLDFPGE